MRFLNCSDDLFATGGLGPQNHIFRNNYSANLVFDTVLVIVVNLPELQRTQRDTELLMHRTEERPKAGSRQFQTLKHLFGTSIYIS